MASFPAWRETNPAGGEKEARDGHPAKRADHHHHDCWHHSLGEVAEEEEDLLLPPPPPLELLKSPTGVCLGDEGATR